MVKITKVEAFAGREGTIKAEGDTASTDGEYLAGARDVTLDGDLGGGVGITFGNGMKLLIGDDGAGLMEVSLMDADGEPLPVGRMSWSSTYHFEVPER